MTQQGETAQRLPSGWIWTKLEDICSEPQYGWTTSATTEGRLHLLRTSDITSGEIDWNSVPFCKKEPDEIEKYLIKDGDILISRAGSVGFSTLINNPRPAIFASYLIRFRPLLENRYVALFLKTPFYWQSISERSVGIALPNVNASKLRKIPLPLAPLNEQRRIVSRVEELFSVLDAGVESLRKVKAELKRYRQAVLKYAFEGKLTEEWRKTHKDQIEPVQELLVRARQERKEKMAGKYKELPPVDASGLSTLPESWKWIRLAEICEKMQYGTSEKASKDPSGIPVLRMGNIKDGKIIFDNLKYFPEDWSNLKEFLLNDGDVLFNRTNSAELVGKTAVYKEHHPKAIFASYLIRVQTGKTTYIPEILSYFINSLHGRKYISSVVSQQVGQANVNGTKLSLMPIPLISHQEQIIVRQEIERHLSISDKMEEATEQSLERAEFMRQSILKVAFAGKLVPQDPTDEPAEKLVERIREKRAKQMSKEGTNKMKRSKETPKEVGLMRYVE